MHVSMLYRKAYTPTPITDALRSGLYLSAANLVLGPPTRSGQTIHRVADTHFERRDNITWVRFTLHHNETGTTISTDVPTLNQAARECAEFLDDARKRRAEIAGWLGDMAGDI